MFRNGLACYPILAMNDLDPVTCRYCGRSYPISLCPDCARSSVEQQRKDKKALGTKPKRKSRHGKQSKGD